VSTRELYHLLHVVTTASQPYPPAHHRHRRAVAAAPPPEPAGASSSRTTLTQGSPETTTSVSTSASNNFPSLCRSSPSSPSSDRRPAAIAASLTELCRARTARKPHLRSSLEATLYQPRETLPSSSLESRSAAEDPRTAAGACRRRYGSRPTESRNSTNCRYQVRQRNTCS
jgi:hypothetical protein